MDDSRKKHGWKFWTTISLTILLAYTLSQGPAGWLITREWSQEWMFSAYLAFYRPLMTVQAWLDTNGPRWIVDSIYWYLALWR